MKDRTTSAITGLFASLLITLSLVPAAFCWEYNLDINLHFREQSDWIWAASIQSVLEYYGKDEAQCSIANAIPEYGNVCCGSSAYLCNGKKIYPPDISSVFRNRGLIDNISYGPYPWASVVSTIDAGRPFVIGFEYRDETDETQNTSQAVARGYDPSGPYIVYLDPTWTYLKDAYWWLERHDWPIADDVYDHVIWGASNVILNNPAPDCKVTGASSNSNTTANLTGTVNANTRATAVTFRLSTTPADQANNFSNYYESATSTPVSGVYDTSINAAWSNLSPGTIYYYQIKAVSSGGTCLSVPGTFTTGAVPGACSSTTNGHTLATKPTTNLCSVGSASTVTGTGPWNWTCTNGGSTASCSAAIQTYQFTIWILSAAGSGTVTPSTGTINWYYNGIMGISGFYNYGTPVTLTASPASGYAFTGWGADGLDSACSGTGKCDLIMGASGATAYAGFTPVKTLSVTKLGTGKGTITSTSPSSPIINCGSTCTNSFIQNTAVTLTATPNPGNIFTGWTGACSGKGPCTVTMSTPQSVSATFVPDITPILMMLLDD